MEEPGGLQSLGSQESGTTEHTRAHGTGQCRYINQKPETTVLIGNKVGVRFKKEDKDKNSIMLMKM